MVLISKSEKAELIEAFPNLVIVRTMRQDSKRGHYYCTEDRNAMKMLRDIRSRNVVEEHPVKYTKNNKRNKRNR